MRQEREIVQDLISKWISLGLEFAAGAPGVTALYIYVSSELGSVYPEIFFEQDGEIRYADSVVGANTGDSRTHTFHKLQFEDLRDAQDEFDAAGVPRPTEYRVYYEIETRKLDVQLSRELIYANDPIKIPEIGALEWFGDRAPKLI